jgi:hypothetical protein
MSGRVRTLLSTPVVTSYQSYVQPGDLFIVAVGEVNASTEARVREAYKPVNMRTIPNMEAAELNLTCETETTGAKYALVQFVGVRVAYWDVLKSEQQRGKQYGWIVRLRTDLVFFEPLTVHGLDSNLAHIPSGGMSSWTQAKWTNDHFFVCPRHLCKPYFTLLDLWFSDNCVASVTTQTSNDGAAGTGRPPTHNSSLAPSGVFATNHTPDGHIEANEVPSYNYTIPSAFPFFSEWYILVRYSLDGRCALDLPENATTCDLMHEFDPPAYTIARGTEYSWRLDCSYTLSNNTWRSSQTVWPHMNACFEVCEQQSVTHIDLDCQGLNETAL